MLQYILMEVLYYDLGIIILGFILEIIAAFRQKGLRTVLERAIPLSVYKTLRVNKIFLEN